MIYNTDGSIRVTVVTGSSFTGIQAPDGSINVVINDGTQRLGRQHPCGAVNAVILTSPSLSTTAPNGSIYIVLRNGSYVIYTGAGASSTASSPNLDVKTITGTDLIAYWDANRGDLIRSISSVLNSWTDIVGGYVLSVADGPTSPGYSPTAFNGAPCLTFSNAQYMTTTDANLMAALPSGANPCEIWIVCSQEADPADTTERYAVGYAGSSVVTGRAISRVVTTGVNNARGRTGIGASATSVTDTGDFTGIHVIRHIVGATTSSISVDSNTAVSAAAVPATTNTRLRVGSIPAAGASNNWQGKIAAVIITQPLSADKATALHNYFG